MERIDFSLTARKTQERAGRIFAVCAVVRKKRHGRVSVNGAQTVKKSGRNRMIKTVRQKHGGRYALSCGCHAAVMRQLFGRYAADDMCLLKEKSRGRGGFTA